MEITKARLKQIIMEEIQKFMVVNDEEATQKNDMIDASKKLEDAAEEQEKSQKRLLLFKMRDTFEEDNFFLDFSKILP